MLVHEGRAGRAQRLLSLVASQQVLNKSVVVGSVTAEVPLLLPLVLANCGDRHSFESERSFIAYAPHPRLSLWKYTGGNDGKRSTSRMTQLASLHVSKDYALAQAAPTQ